MYCITCTAYQVKHVSCKIKLESQNDKEKHEMMMEIVDGSNKGGRRGDRREVKSEIQSAAEGRGQ